MFIWTIGDFVAGIFALLVLILLVGALIIKAIRQALCKHRTIYTNGLNHDEVCRSCGKNFGFAGRDNR
jgi:hypothetical protein